MQVSPNFLISTDQSYAPGSTRTPTKTLNQDDFLKLVLAQLTNQDPLNPQKDTEFIAQMTQFSALEQSKSMQQDIAKLQTDQQFMQANSMLGRAVTLQDDRGSLISGTVTAIASNFGSGAIANTGYQTDLAVAGEGFFVVRDPVTAAQFATRAGDFRLDSNGYLVTSTGQRVQGYSDGTLATVGDVRIDGTG